MVKLYVEEAGRPDVLLAMSRATRWSTSAITYAEVRAALASARRDHRLDEESLRLARDRFRADWQNYLTIAITQAIVESAADLSETHALRAVDAIHLASLEALRGRMSDDIEFAVADGRLRTAALSEGFVVTRIRTA
jgi:hypothetical protein